MGKHTLIWETKFDAAHYLPHDDGNCSRMHGHTWRLRIFVEGIPRGHGCMVMNFRSLKEYVWSILSKIDHATLNEAMHEESPTCEKVSEWLFPRLYKKIAAGGASLVAVEVYEGGANGCRYEPDGEPKLPKGCSLDG